MNAFYDDPFFDYSYYWHKRGYEHLSEINALKTFFAQIPYSRRKNLLDIGSGFGRLTKTYCRTFKKCVLLEPSQKLQKQAERRLKSYKNLVFKLGFAEKIPVKDATFQTVLMVRVAHHIRDLKIVFKEIFRVLDKNGFFILEFPNKRHFKTRFCCLFKKRRKTDLKSLLPSEARSIKNIRKKTVPFYNYHPLWVERNLEDCGFIVLKKLSVSNFRHFTVKKAIPLKIMLFLEKFCQPFLAYFNFGPSIFLLLKKR